MKSTCKLAASALAHAATLLAFAACAAPKRATTPPVPPSEAPLVVSVAAAQSAPLVEANRDKHGHGDVDVYVANLESNKRVAEMRPDFVVASLQLAPDAVIADLGCGPGVFALRFARACPRGVVYAVDVEPRQLDRLREHVLAEKLDNVVPVLCSSASPHLPPGRCDVVFIGDTYHHFDERVDYMRRLKSAFSPNGRLVLFEYKAGPLPVGPPPQRKLQDGELVKELTEAGYVLLADFKSHEYHDFQVWKPAR